jgi:DNA-binding transcriptional LysR family regulator
MFMGKANQWDERIGRRLKLRDLHVFMTVLHSGSMGKAAAQLAVSQPAISKAIADLEHTMGVRLLDRTAQGVEPTRYGEALLKWGSAVFDDLRQGVKEIEFLADPTTGEVRVGSTEVMTAGLVPAVVDRMSRQFPRLVFNIVQAPTIALQYRDLRERSVDLTLGRIVTPTADEDLNIEILFDDPLLVVAGIDSKWSKRRSIEAAELIDEPWGLPPYDNFIGSRVADAFRGCGLDPPIRTVTTSSIQLLTALLATGRFLAVLSRSALQLSGKRLGLKAVPVDLPLRSGPVGIVTLRNRTLSPVAKLFIECAREVARPFVERKDR